MLAMSSTYHRTRISLAALVATIALRLALGASAAQAASLVIEGAGDGHGVGMSQEGALGYAEHGASYAQILAHYYTGTAIGQAPAGAEIRVLVGSRVQQVPLEAYVRGVVSAEVPASWPLAVLEAQAVASRTYALTAHAGGSRFDVYSDTRSQVYRGVAAHTPQTDAAVAATAGQIVTYRGSPAISYFFASSGGRTENVENVWPGSSPEPWLRGVLDPYDQGPLHHWRLTLSFASAGARLRGLVRGSFQGIEVLKRGFSPRILAADVLGSRGRTLVSGAQLQGALGLSDTWAYFSVQDAHGLRSEPDRSGGEPPAPPAAAAPPAAGPQSGSPAPSSGAPPTGGVAAS
jgi:stage II sporulation protein D